MLGRRVGSESITGHTRAGKAEIGKAETRFLSGVAEARKSEPGQVWVGVPGWRGGSEAGGCRSSDRFCFSSWNHFISAGRESLINWRRLLLIKRGLTTGEETGRLT